MKSRENLFGAWAVLLGVVIAVGLGVFQKTVLISYHEWVYVLLVILGLIVGAMSVSHNSREATTFLLATVSLVIVSSMGQERLLFIGNVGLFIVTILNALLTMFIPATIIVALKAVFSVASVK